MDFEKETAKTIKSSHQLIIIASIILLLFANSSFEAGREEEAAIHELENLREFLKAANTTERITRKEYYQADEIQQFLKDVFKEKWAENSQISHNYDWYRFQNVSVNYGIGILNSTFDAAEWETPRIYDLTGMDPKFRKHLESFSNVSQYAIKQIIVIEKQKVFDHTYLVNLEIQSQGTPIKHTVENLTLTSIPFQIKNSKEIATEHGLVEQSIQTEILPKTSLFLETLNKGEMSIEGAIGKLRRDIHAERGKLSILGVIFPYELAYIGGPSIIIILQFYLGVMLRRFFKLEGSNEVLEKFPWIGFVKENIPMWTNIVLSILLPTIAATFAIFTSDIFYLLRASLGILIAIFSIGISTWSYYPILKANGSFN